MSRGEELMGGWKGDKRDAQLYHKQSILKKNPAALKEKNIFSVRWGIIIELHYIYPCIYYIAKKHIKAYKSTLNSDFDLGAKTLV